MTTGDDDGPCPDQIDVDALFEAQERDRRRRRGWIAAALVGVVAAGAVTGGVATGAFSGGDDDTDAAGSSATPAPDRGSESPSADPSESPGADPSESPSADSGSDPTGSGPPESSTDASPMPGVTPGTDGSPGAPPSGDAAPERTAPTSYVVSSGDSLWSITESALPGDPSDQMVMDTWPTIYRANRAVIGDDPNLIRPDQQLSVPALDAGPADAGPAGAGATGSAPSADSSRQTVAQGDSLWSITQDALGGDATADQVLEAWPTVYEANRQVIGDDPDLIFAGQQLVIPPLG